MSRDVAGDVRDGLWRHRSGSESHRAMSLAMCGTSFGDIALAQNHIARCRRRCVAELASLAVGPWARALGPGPGPRDPGPFFLNNQCFVLCSRVCLLARGRKSSNWMCLWPSRGGARFARRKEGWPACGRPRHVARHDLGALAMSRDVAKGGLRCRATWPRRLWRHRATWKMGVGDVARRRPRGLATSPATSRNHAFTSRDIATWLPQLLFSYLKSLRSHYGAMN